MESKELKRICWDWFGTNVKIRDTVYVLPERAWINDLHFSFRNWFATFKLIPGDCDDWALMSMAWATISKARKYPKRPELGIAFGLATVGLDPGANLNNIVNNSEIMVMHETIFVIDSNQIPLLYEPQTGEMLELSKLNPDSGVGLSFLWI